MQSCHLSGCIRQMSLTTWSITIGSSPLQSQWSLGIQISKAVNWQKCFMFLFNKQFMEMVSNMLDIRVPSVSCLATSRVHVTEIPGSGHVFSPILYLSFCRKTRSKSIHSPNLDIWEPPGSTAVLTFTY